MFYIQNALQPLMMTLPYLSGEFSVADVATQMRRGYAEWAKLFADQFKKSGSGVKEKWHSFGNLRTAVEASTLDKNLKDMLKDMSQRNLLDLGAQSDFGEFKGSEGWMKALNGAMNEIDVATRGVEFANRYVSAVAAYRLMTNKLKSKGNLTEKEIHQAATDYVAQVLSATQGDYSAINAPSAFNTRVGKIALQFRKFSAIQLNYFTRMVKDMNIAKGKNLTEEQKQLGTVVKRQLTMAFVTHLFMAGVKGAPAMTIAMAIVGALFGEAGEDDEDTMRRLLHEAGANATVADIILEGLPSGVLGWNLSDNFQGFYLSHGIYF